jgi:Transposase DDE domain
MVSFDAALRHVKRDVDGLLDPHAIHALCETHRHAWRPGVLGPAQTLGLMLRQVAEGNVTGGQVVRMAGGAFSESAWCQARQRLPLEVLRDVGRAIAEQVRESAGVAGAPLWHGRRVRLIDATNFSMPDTPELRAYFGDLPGQKPGCGFPVAHCLMIFGKEGGELAYWDASPHKTGDLRHTHDAHAQAIRPGDVLLGDDAFSAYVHLAMLKSRGADGVFPTHHARLVDFTSNRVGGPNAPKGSPGSRWVQSLGRDDQLVEYFKPTQRPRWMTPEQFDAIPPSMIVREVRRTVHRKGFRPMRVTVATTLLDAEAYPADEVVALRLERWEVETDLRHLKTTMKMEVLRSETVAGVKKELAAFAVVYNLARLVMANAARRQGVDVRRLSFADALAWLRHAEPGQDPPRLKVVPLRPDRVEPRAVKRRPKPFDLLNRPRDEMRNTIRNKQQRMA